LHAVEVAQDKASEKAKTEYALGLSR
jgi:hypothetical protein